MTKPATKWIVVVGTSTSDGGFAHLDLSFHPCHKVDSAQRLASAIRDGSEVAHWTAVVREAQDKSGSTVVYSKAIGSGITVSMQANTEGYDQLMRGGKTENSGWYAPSVSGANLDAISARAMAKLAKAHTEHTYTDSDPSVFIKALKATPARYLDAGCSVYCDDNSPDMASPVDKEDNAKEGQ